MSKKDPFWERENKKQFDKLLEWASSGDVHAIFSVAENFYNGVLVDKNIYESAKWYKLAADAGHLGAMFKLNEMYANGEISASFLPEPYHPPKPQKSSSSFGKPKKSSTKPSKKVYDGSFGNVDPNLSALYNDEHFGYEDKTMIFKENYGRKKTANRYNYDDDSSDFDDSEEDEDGY